MIEIHIDLVKLQALALLASPDDLRPYLQGVYVEATASDTRLAATNGSYMGMLAGCIPSDFENKGCEWETLILPLDLIAKCKPPKSSPGIGTVLIERTPTIDTYVMRLWDGTLIPFQPIVGTYPDLRRVVPSGEGSGEGAQLNPDFLALFCKVQRALGAKREQAGSVWVTWNGTDAASRVHLGKYPAFIGALMPRRIKAGEDPRAYQTWPDKGADHG